MSLVERKSPRRKARAPRPSHLVATPSAAVSALRRGRRAIEDIEEQLQRLLTALRAEGPIDADTPDRLRAATAEAGAALAALADVRAT